MEMQSSVNFHHLSSKKFLPSFSNQACSFEVYHLDKGHRNKAAASETEVCPPVVLAWLPYQPFSFPKQLLPLPLSGALGSYSLRGPYSF
jgi:hypothetical protein